MGKGKKGGKEEEQYEQLITPRHNMEMEKVEEEQEEDKLKYEEQKAEEIGA